MPTETTTTVRPTSAVDDIDMNFFSRDSLQGASSVTRGVLHGQAQGNVYNMADKIKADNFVTKDVTDKVHIFRLHGNLAVSYTPPQVAVESMWSPPSPC